MIGLNGVIVLSSLAGAIVTAMLVFRNLRRPANVPPVPFSESATAIIEQAHHEASAQGDGVTTPEHILRALLNSPSIETVQLLRTAHVDIAGLHETLQEKPVRAVGSVHNGRVFAPRSYEVLTRALREAFQSRSAEATPAHLLSAILVIEKSLASHALRKSGVTLTDGAQPSAHRHSPKRSIPVTDPGTLTPS